MRTEIACLIGMAISTGCAQRFSDSDGGSVDSGQPDSGQIPVDAGGDGGCGGNAGCPPGLYCCTSLNEGDCYTGQCYGQSLRDAGQTDAGLYGGLSDGGVCGTILSEMTQLVEAPQGCVQSSDCTVTCPGLCTSAGAWDTWLPVTTGFADEFQPLADAWFNDGCDPGSICLSCPVVSPVLCVGGICAQAAAGSEPCTVIADCPTPVDTDFTALCLTDGGFTNGYCAQDCINGWECEYSLQCEPLPSAPSHPGLCLMTCGNDSDCRTSDGYVCCPDWSGGVNGISSVCYPGPCPNPPDAGVLDGG